MFKAFKSISLFSLLLLAGSSGLGQETSDDAWDMSQGAVIVNHSGDRFGTIPNLIGGTVWSPQPLATFFRDDQDAGFVHFVELQTACAMDLVGYEVTAGSDHTDLPGDRGFSLCRLFYWEELVGGWIQVDEWSPGGAVYGGKFTREIVPVYGDRFRVEFVQLNGQEGIDPGPRVMEIDAISSKSPKAGGRGDQRLLSANKADFSDLTDMILTGAVAGINPGGTGVENAIGQSVLRLTDDFDQSSGAFLREPLRLKENDRLEVAFSFQISDPAGYVDHDGWQGADGFNFILAPLPITYGGAGGVLANTWIVPSLAVEFDTWRNDPLFDPDGNHLAIVEDSILNPPLVVKGLDPIERGLNSGEVYYCWIDIDDLTDTTEVRLSKTAERPATPIIVADGTDLSRMMGLCNEIYLGFAGATGGAANDQDILSLRAQVHPWNTAPRISCDPMVTFECNREARDFGRVVYVDIADDEQETLTISWSIDGNPIWSGEVNQGTTGFWTNLPSGDYELVAVVSDGFAEIRCSIHQRVIDTVSPSIEIHSASESVLWPPNGRWVPVTITGRIWDECEGLVDPSVSVSAFESGETVTSEDARVESFEWDEAGHFELTLQLRARRLGKGTGRVYSIVLSASDASGNSNESVVNVDIPHDSGKK